MPWNPEDEALLLELQRRKQRYENDAARGLVRFIDDIQDCLQVQGFEGPLMHYLVANAAPLRVALAPFDHVSLS